MWEILMLTSFIRRSPSNIRLTTSVCLHLVTRGSLPVTWQRWRSHHSICHSPKPILHVNFMPLCFIEQELVPREVLHCENKEFRPFCSCDLDLDPMTFIYELDSYSPEIYQVCKYELLNLRLSKVIMRQTDRQTDTTEIVYHAALRNSNYSLVNNNNIIIKHIV